MAINCQKCLYHMTQTEAISYLTIHMGPVLKDIVLPYLVTLYTKRGILHEMSQDAILPLINYFKVECHICMSYQGWSRDLKQSSENSISQQEQK